MVSLPAESSSVHSLEEGGPTCLGDIAFLRPPVLLPTMPARPGVAVSSWMAGS